MILSKRCDGRSPAPSTVDAMQTKSTNLRAAASPPSSANCHSSYMSARPAPPCELGGTEELALRLDWPDVRPLGGARAYTCDRSRR